MAVSDPNRPIASDVLVTSTLCALAGGVTGFVLAWMIWGAGN